MYKIQNIFVILQFIIQNINQTKMFDIFDTGIINKNEVRQKLKSRLHFT